MRNKKSEGLPLNIIIIAVIGLIVLVILAFIFRGESNKFIKGTSTCPARDGVCLEGNPDCPDDKPVKIYTSDCKEVKKGGEGNYEPTKNANGKIIGPPGQCCIPLT